MNHVKRNRFIFKSIDISIDESLLIFLFILFFRLRLLFLHRHFSLQQNRIKPKIWVRIDFCGGKWLQNSTKWTNERNAKTEIKQNIKNEIIFFMTSGFFKTWSYKYVAIEIWIENGKAKMRMKSINEKWNAYCSAFCVSINGETASGRVLVECTL